MIRLVVEIRDFETLDLPTIDPLSPEYLVDRGATLAAAREQSWLGRTPFGPIVLTYDDANELLRRPERELHQIITGDQRLAFGNESGDEEAVTGGPIYRFLQECEAPFTRPESHQRIRKLCVPSFTPAQVERWPATMREIAERLVEEFARESECEFVSQFAARYPAEVFARIAGIPIDDLALFLRWVDDIGLAWHRPLEPVRERAEAAIEGLFEYVGDLIEKRQRDLGDDLISQLIRAEAEGDRLSFAELRGITVLLIFAAHDNTKNQLSLIVRELVEHPEVWRRLAEDPTIAPTVVNEGMRLHPVIQDHFRITSMDVVHRAVRFSPGTAIHLPAAAANRDPSVFTDPDRLDPERENAARQLSFGAGHHYCLGANLARADMAEALVVLARAMPNPRLLEFKEADARANGRRPEVLRLAFDSLSFPGGSMLADESISAGGSR